MINEFWKSWKNKTKKERIAIKSIKRAMDFLFDNISKNKVIAVYIKGSFVTREMNERSDVDIVPILKDNLTLKKLKIVRDKNKEMIAPSELLPITLTELKKNENSKIHGKLKGRPDTFLKDLEYHKLIWGRKISKEDYPMRDERKMFENAFDFVKNQTIPMHKRKEFGFRQLIKQLFWIAYAEQRILGKNPPRTWKGLNRFIKNKNHIIHDAYRYRMNHTKDEKKRNAFVSKLEDYLSRLQKVLKIKSRP